MEPKPEQLKQIAMAIMGALRRISAEECHRMLTMVEYHGFAKARFPEHLLVEALAPHGLTSEEVQIEVVYVDRDLSHEVHYHERTTAFVMVMGKDVHCSPPHLAKAYCNDWWVDLHEGDEIAIPTGMRHGFTVGEGGHLFFLSVQSPPLVRDDGHDDYINAVAMK